MVSVYGAPKRLFCILFFVVVVYLKIGDAPSAFNEVNDDMDDAGAPWGRVMNLVGYAVRQK